MSELKLPLAPDIKDGEGILRSKTTDAFLRADVRIRVSAQVEEDGAYRTSVIEIGSRICLVEIFADRDQMERLHRLIGQHLQQLDQYETDLGIYHASNAERPPEGRL